MNGAPAASTITRGFRSGTVLLCLCLAAVFCQTDVAYGWSARRDLKPRWPHWTSPVGSTTVRSVDGSTLPAENVPDIEPQALLEVSTVPKQLWFECGLVGDCTNASLYYVDPAVATPVKILFASGVMIGGDGDQHSIPTGTLNTSTYQLTNLKLGYIIYFKDGKIYSANTTTLTKTQLSSETGVTADKLCESTPHIDWKTPLNSTLVYELSGPDDQCYTIDDVMRAVKLSMTALSTPISLPGKQVVNQLFDGTYLIANWSVGKIQRCQSNLITCTDIRTISGAVRRMSALDASRVLFMDGGTWSNDSYTGGTLRSYRYNVVPPVLATLYTAGPTEMVGEARLDRDGFVYFPTLSTAAPYTGKIKKVPYGGGIVTTLHTFTLPGPVADDSVWIDLSPSHIVAYYPNATSGTAVSVEKATPAVKMLSSGFTTGGVVGGYLYYEDSLAKVSKVSLSLTLPGVISKPDAQLVGVSYGGSADYHYGFNTLTFRVFLKAAANGLRSYAFSDDISVGTAGILVGTVPTNLCNSMGMGWGPDVLVFGEKRNTDFSFGTDILYFRATTPSTLKRMTNANGQKEFFFDDWY